MACGCGSSDRRSLADWVELPVDDRRANGLAHGLTGQHSLDLPAPSGGLFALRRSYQPRVFRKPGGKSGSPGDADGVEIKSAEMKVDGVAESFAVAEPAR